MKIERALKTARRVCVIGALAVAACLVLACEEAGELNTGGSTCTAEVAAARCQRCLDSCGPTSCNCDISCSGC